MTISADVHWPALAARMADDLAEKGKLTGPRWRAAVCAVPRHELVPTYYFQDSSGAWQRSDTDSEASRAEWLATVYSNSVLITALTDTVPPRVLSSSTQPGLMTRMLEALDVEDGHTVLEIGTGTGYNAALLCHRLGSDHVFSIDVEPGLVDLARDRLRRMGFTPTLAVGDGAGGLSPHSPFDRVIATCAVPAVPWTWVEQTAIGGAVLTDLKIAPSAGSLVRITRTSLDRAQGHFDPTYAAFMGLRPESGAPDRDTTWADRDISQVETHVTTVDPMTPWTSLGVWFLAAFTLGPDITIGFSGDDTSGPPTHVSISTPDGAWARIATTADANGGHEVVQGGPRRLWEAVEDAHQLWTDTGRPGWGRFGLTVTPTEQVVWLDEPDGAHRWPVKV